LIRKIKDQESAIHNYIILIDNMTREMESAKNKLVLNNQEIQFIKEENMHLRTRLNEFQFDLMTTREKLVRAEGDRLSTLPIIEGKLNKANQKI